LRKFEELGDALDGIEVDFESGDVSTQPCESSCQCKISNKGMGTYSRQKRRETGQR
jgi:hypothetical protein